MSDRLNTTAKHRQNLDSTFKVSPFRSRGFGVQTKLAESTPVSKAELWENYQQTKQLNQKGTNISALTTLPIQTKLTILQRRGSTNGQPGDKYEQEADSVADRVMAMSEPTQVQREELPEKDALTANELTHMVQQNHQIQCQNASKKKDVAESNVNFLRFLNSGTGLTKRPLGMNTLLLYMMNGVELQFEANRSAMNNYRNIQPLQWSGPESIWIKKGDIFTQQWSNISQRQGNGSDNPEPESIAKEGYTIAYADDPGINIGSHGKNSRVYVVQNFTGWIDGSPKTGGSSKRLSEVVSWHSIISLFNSNWENPKSTPSWQIFNNQSGLGWRSTGQPDSI
jgi:hypothetical protein